MRQMFSRPDWHISHCGALKAVVDWRRIPGAPKFMHGLRVLFISDLHITPATTPSNLESLIAQIESLAPDLLLLGGDYADAFTHTQRFFGALRELPPPPLGIFAVLGNNDREACPNLDILYAQAEAAGVRLLVNQSEVINLKGGYLHIAGIDEHRYGAPNSDGLYPKTPLPNTYRLLLSHYPCLPKILPDLILSGHTHGGQFNLLGITPYTLGFERILHCERAPEHIAGLLEMENFRLFVSKGVGASRIPLRIGVRPEINMLYFDD